MYKDNAKHRNTINTDGCRKQYVFTHDKNAKYIHTITSPYYLLNDMVYANTSELDVYVTSTHQIIVDKYSNHTINKVQLHAKIYDLWRCTIENHNRRRFGNKQTGSFKYSCGCQYDVGLNKDIYGTNDYIYCKTHKKIVYNPQYINSE